MNLLLIGCTGGKESDQPRQPKPSAPIKLKGPEAQSNGGYSGGGGDVNAYGSEEFKAIFREAVDHARRLHLSVPFYLMFLKFDNKLPEPFEEILERALKTGEGQVGLIKYIDIKFDSYCSSSSRSKSHASVNYTLDSVVCVSSMGLELMSKAELKRKLLALLAHEYVHMLGIKDEDLADSYQHLIYNNYHMIDNNHVAAAFWGSLRLMYESLYYFFYRDCVLNNMCSDKLEFTKRRVQDLLRRKPKRTELLSILGKIETQIDGLGADYRGVYFIIDSTLIDPTTWEMSDKYLVSDYPQFEELEKLKAYLTETEALDENRLKKLALAFVRKTFQLNFLHRVAQVGLVSRYLFFNYCYRPFPAHNKITADLLDDFVGVKNFTYEKMDKYLSRFGVKTVYYGPEVIYLPHSRLCSMESKSIPAYSGKPTEPPPENSVPLLNWMSSYVVY